MERRMGSKGVYVGTADPCVSEKLREDQVGEEGSEEDDFIDEEEAFFLEDVAKPYHRYRKGQRISASLREGGPSEVITKHDAAVCGRLNARRMEQFVDGNLVDEMVSIPTKTYNSLKEHMRKMEARKIRHKGAEDRAVTGGATDMHTRIALLQLLNLGLIEDLSGIISTGKEANIYHALQGSYLDESGKPPIAATEYAVKVFKPLHQFTNRAQYVEGAFLERFVKCKRNNNRKCLRMWAQKELHNLKRLQSGGVPCPAPVGMHGHCLVMEFIGEKGFPAPMLKDVTLNQEVWNEIYTNVVTLMWKMFHKCRIVHADFSEYNILYRRGELYVIDVAQAVSHDHRHAMDFLRRDCFNICTFFKQKGLPSMLTTLELFQHVTDPLIVDSNQKECLQLALEKTKLRQQHDDSVSSAQLVDEEVFLNSFLPRTLNEVPDPVRYIYSSRAGDMDTKHHLRLIGMRPDLTGTATQPVIMQEP